MTTTPETKYIPHLQQENCIEATCSTVVDIVRIDLHRVGPTANSGLDPRPDQGRPGQYMAGEPVAQRHKWEVGARAHDDEVRRHTPHRLTLLIEGALPATGSATAGLHRYHFTNTSVRHGELLFRAVRSTSMFPSSSLSILVPFVHDLCRFTLNRKNVPNDLHLDVSFKFNNGIKARSKV
jgi:hypothetical protein